MGAKRSHNVGVVRHFVRKEARKMSFFFLSRFQLVQNVEQVHFHVPLLDAGGGECTQGRKVLCQAGSGY
jgi:hypothetical protein